MQGIGPSTLAVALIIAPHPMLSSATGQPACQSPQYLIIRYDDYSPFPLYRRADGSPSIERRLFALIEQHDAKIAVGIVPFADQPPGIGPASAPLEQSWLAAEDEWVQLLREYVHRGVVEPALHGFTHRRNTPPGHRPGEFRGQPLKWQQEAIRVGSTALQTALNSRVDVFIPPWNAWDESTATALAENGFLWLSADLHHAEGAPLPVRAVPQTTADPAVALEWVNTSTLPAGLVLTLVTHPFDFEGAGAPQYWADLHSLLAAIQKSDCWLAVGFGDLPSGPEVNRNSAFADAVAVNNAARILEDSLGGPLFLGGRTSGTPLNLYTAPNVLPMALLASTWIVLVTLVGMGAGLLLPRLPIMNPGLLLATMSLAFVLALWLSFGAMEIHQRGYALRGIRWQALAFAGGATAGLMVGSIRWFQRRRKVALSQDAPSAGSLSELRFSHAP